MKTKFGLSVIVITVALGTARSAVAEQATPKDSPAARADGASPKQWNKLERADKIIGLEVRNGQNEKLGTVKDLAVDLKNGRIAEVIVGSGGILGVDEKLTAAPPSDFTCDPAMKQLEFKADSAKFKDAPALKYSNGEADFSPVAVREVYQYYGALPYFTVEERPGVNTSGTASTTQVNTPSGTVHAAEAQTGASTETAKAQTHGATEMVNAKMIRLGEVQRASKLMGSAVRNRQDQTVGDVKDLIVNLPMGRLAEVIVASGGFLGMGDQFSAVPPEVFQQGPGQYTLILDISKEALAENPHFDATGWDKAGEQASVAAVYRSYHVQPYFEGAPENTGSMARENHALTPVKQGTSTADKNITRQIRQQITAAQGLSITARNIEIFTLNGRVTLRGPVKSQDEKRRIGDIAARVASASNVDNQLTVQAILPTSSVN